MIALWWYTHIVSGGIHTLQVVVYTYCKWWYTHILQVVVHTHCKWWYTHIASVDIHILQVNYSLGEIIRWKLLGELSWIN